MRRAPSVLLRAFALTLAAAALADGSGAQGAENEHDEPPLPAWLEGTDPVAALAAERAMGYAHRFSAGAPLYPLPRRYPRLRTPAATRQQQGVPPGRMLSPPRREAAGGAEGGAFADELQPRPRPRRAARLGWLGCGKCGTHAVGALLGRAGVAATHERERHGDGAVLGWMFTAGANFSCQARACRGGAGGAQHQHSAAAAGQATTKMAFFPEGISIRADQAPEVPQCNKERLSVCNEDFSRYPVFPLFMATRHPLAAIRASAKGFTDLSYGCGAPDAFSWRFAARVVPLPPFAACNETAVAAAVTSGGSLLGAITPARLEQSLVYWLRWNVYARAHAAQVFRVEDVTLLDVSRAWCSHCDESGLCDCPWRIRRVADDGEEGRFAKRRVTPRADHVASMRSSAGNAALRWEDLANVNRAATAAAWQLAQEFGYSDEVPQPAAASGTGANASALRPARPARTYRAEHDFDEDVDERDEEDDALWLQSTSGASLVV